MANYVADTYIIVLQNTYRVRNCENRLKIFYAKTFTLVHAISAFKRTPLSFLDEMFRHVLLLKPKQFIPSSLITT